MQAKSCGSTANNETNGLGIKNKLFVNKPEIFTKSQTE